jgi:sulfide:quinone oxidoreductase
MKIAARYGIKLHFNSNLIEVNGETKEAVFETTKADGKERLTVQFDMLHVAPPMSAPDAIKNSPLAVKDPFGWVDVNRDTLQHNRYKNVFSLGDVANAGDTKTGAAVMKQVPVLIKNLLTGIEMKTNASPALYNGYTSCPLTTGYGKLLLAEFDHDNSSCRPFPLIPEKRGTACGCLSNTSSPGFIGIVCSGEDMRLAVRRNTPRMGTRHGYDIPRHACSAGPRRWISIRTSRLGRGNL